MTETSGQIESIGAPIQRSSKDCRWMEFNLYADDSDYSEVAPSSLLSLCSTCSNQSTEDNDDSKSRRLRLRRGGRSRSESRSSSSRSKGRSLSGSKPKKTMSWSKKVLRRGRKSDHSHVELLSEEFTTMD